jgi:hypothetical protein
MARWITLLHHAARLGQTEISRLLLEAAPAAVYNTGITVVHAATNHGLDNMLQLLVKHGARPDKAVRSVLSGIKLPSSIPRILSPEPLIANPFVFEKAPNPVFFRHLWSNGPAAWNTPYRHVPGPLLIDDTVPDQMLPEETTEDDWGHEEFDEEMIDVASHDFLAEDEADIPEPCVESDQRQIATQNDEQKIHALECCGMTFRTPGART